ncbi:hypothetical protein N7475_002773 [Penicillium sp. IBT 31633x]|nr:hypothetical protein N7475_002773 [Penicillium sp. IBT 31633x]
MDASIRRNEYMIKRDSQPHNGEERMGIKQKVQLVLLLGVAETNFEFAEATETDSDVQRREEGVIIDFVES